VTIAECRLCGEVAVIAGRAMCQTCYQRWYRDRQGREVEMAKRQLARAEQHLANARKRLAKAYAAKPPAAVCDPDEPVLGYGYADHQPDRSGLPPHLREEVR